MSSLLHPVRGLRRALDHCASFHRGTLRILGRGGRFLHRLTAIDVRVNRMEFTSYSLPNVLLFVPGIIDLVSEFPTRSTCVGNGRPWFDRSVEDGTLHFWFGRWYLAVSRPTKRKEEARRAEWLARHEAEAAEWAAAEPEAQP